MRLAFLPRRPAMSVEEEAGYGAFRTAQVVPFERLAAVAGAVTILLFVWWDVLMFEVPLGETIMLRGALALMLLSLLAITFTDLGSHHGPTQVLATAVVVGGFSWVLARLPGGFTIGLAGLVLSIALLPMLAITLRNMVLLSAIAVLIANLFLAGTESRPATVLNVNLWMILAAALAVSFWWVLDGVNRRLFLSERRLTEERERADRLLENILPVSVADRLKESHETVAERYESVSVMFADIVGFTSFAKSLEPAAVVELLNGLFSRFDELTVQLGLEKIKTLGDGYMVAGGVPNHRPDHAAAIADLALSMVEATASFARLHGINWDIRIGIHSGSVVAGVIGTHKFAYDLWGDAVNVASRLESTSEAGRIQVSEATAALLPDEYLLEPRGAVTLKNRGEAITFFLAGRSRPVAREEHDAIGTT